MGREIKDPDTGKVLKRREKTVGTIEVVAVEGGSMAVCKIVSGECVTGDMIK